MDNLIFDYPLNPQNQKVHDKEYFKSKFDQAYQKKIENPHYLETENKTNTHGVCFGAVCDYLVNAQNFENYTWLEHSQEVLRLHLLQEAYINRILSSRRSTKVPKKNNHSPKNPPKKYLTNQIADQKLLREKGLKQHLEKVDKPANIYPHLKSQIEKTKANSKFMLIFKGGKQKHIAGLVVKNNTDKPKFVYYDPTTDKPVVLKNSQEVLANLKGNLEMYNDVFQKITIYKLGKS